jgi:hypothetical protein
MRKKNHNELYEQKEEEGGEQRRRRTQLGQILVLYELVVLHSFLISRFILPSEYYGIIQIS